MEVYPEAMQFAAPYANEQAWLEANLSTHFNDFYKKLNFKKYKFTLQNGMFSGQTAAGLFGILRFFKIRAVIEIGSGGSTKVAQAALEWNSGGA